MNKIHDGSGHRPAFLYWTFLLLLAFLGAAPLIPPAVRTASPETAFSVERAFSLIERISLEPHPMGSEEIKRVRGEIVSQLAALGLEPDIQFSTAPDYFHASSRQIEIANVIARIPGTDSTGAVALVGHFDTATESPGANDDGSAVGVMMETARLVLAGRPLRNDILLVFIGSEEPAPRFGSSAYLAGHPSAGEIAFVINMESSGSSGPPLLVGMNGPGGWIIDQFDESAPYPAAFSFLTALSRLIGGSNTDFSEFQEAGIAGMEFAYLHGSQIYHTPDDLPENVSLRSLQQEGDTVLGLARHFGSLDLENPAASREKVFFTFGRTRIATYPANWSLPIAVLAGILLAAAAWREKAWMHILGSFGLTVGSAFGAAAFLTVLWTAIAGARNRMGVAESYAYLAILLALTLGICLFLSRTGRKNMGTGADALGVLLLWWLFGLLAAVYAPGMSYLFLWTALIGAGAVLLMNLRPLSSWSRLAAALPAAGFAVVLVIPAVDIFYQLAQPRPGNPGSQILFVVAVTILLFAMVAEIVRAFRVRP